MARVHVLCIVLGVTVIWASVANAVIHRDKGQTPNIDRLKAYLASKACRQGPQVPQTAYTGNIYVGNHSFPAGMDAATLVAAGAIVTEPGNYLPWDMNQGFYSPEWLLKYDHLMYKWYNECQHDQFERVFIAQYDGVVASQLKARYAGRQVVGVMGGWLLRNDPMYVQCAEMCRDLSLQGYVVATGGGPGVMECCNLGSKMSVYSDRQFRESLAILAECPSYYVDVANDYKTIRKVLAKFPNTTDKALGVSDWTWPGHNFFCGTQAKMFDDFYREEQLIGLNTAGVIFFTDGATSGFGSQSVGTYLELAVQVLDDGALSERGNQFSTPMIFYGRPWLANGLYQTYMNQAQRRREAMRETTLDNATAPNPRNHYSNKIFFADTVAAVVGIANTFTAAYYPPDRNASQGQAPVFPFPPMPAKAPMPPQSPSDIAYFRAAALAVRELLVADGMTFSVGSGPSIKYFIAAVCGALNAKNWTATMVPSTFRALGEINLYRMNEANVVNYTRLTVTAVLDDRHLGSLHFAVVHAVAAHPALQGVVYAARRDASPLSESIVLRLADKAACIGSLADVTTHVSDVAALPVEVSATTYRSVGRVVERLGNLTNGVHRMIDNGLPKLLPEITPIVTDNGNFVVDYHGWSLSSAPAVHAVAGVLGVGLSTDVISVGYFGDTHQATAHRRTGA